MTRSIPGRSANDRNRSAIASSPKPTPPAAPAPGTSRTRVPAAASSASANCASRRSRLRDIGSGSRPSAGRRRRPPRSDRGTGSRHRTRPRRSTSASRGSSSGRDPRVALVTVGLGAERAQQPGAAIGRGAPADPEHDRSCARIDRGADQVPGPGRCRRDRITFCRVDARQAGRLRHLDVRARPRRIAKPASPDRPTERVRDGRLLPHPTAGRGHRLERPLAAVGERTEEDRVVRPGTGPAIRQRPGHLHRRQRTLERIGRDEDRQRSGRHGPTTAVRLATDAAGSPALRPARRPTGRPLPPAGAARGTRGCGSSAGAPGRPAR